MKKQVSAKRYLIIGLIAAVVTVLGGELPLGWYIKPETGDILQAQFAGYGSVSMPHIASGIFFGGIGIALQGFGYEGISRLLYRDTDCKRTARLTHIGALFCGMFGPLVHILCAAGMYFCKSGSVDEIMQFMLYFVMPITVVFMPVYMAMMVALFIAMIRGKTKLPKWSALLNPAIVMMLVNTVTFLFGNSYISNAVQMANMGIGSFVFFLFLLVKYRTDDEISAKKAL